MGVHSKLLLLATGTRILSLAQRYHSPVRVEEENGRASTAGRSTVRESEYAHLSAGEPR